MLGFPPRTPTSSASSSTTVLEDVSVDEAHPRAERCRARRVPRRAHRRPSSTSPATTSRRSCSTPSSTGQQLQPDHVRGTMVLLLIAGIDTTWTAIGASLWHLAQHPEDRRRLAAEPELHAHRGRGVAARLRAGHDGPHRRRGLRVRRAARCTPGDWVLLPFPAANRDPEVFADADEVVIDRAENRHTAFGLGIHRCLGSNLARHGAAGRARGVDGALSRTSSWPTRARSRGRPARCVVPAALPIRFLSTTG